MVIDWPCVRLLGAAAGKQMTTAREIVDGNVHGFGVWGRRVGESHGWP